MKINSGLLPTSIALQDIFVERRLLYDLNLTVSETLAFLLILLFDVQLTPILEFFFQGTPRTAKPQPGIFPTNLLLLS